jgi:hypothetical protein
MLLWGEGRGHGTATDRLNSLLAILVNSRRATCVAIFFLGNMANKGEYIFSCH